MRPKRLGQGAALAGVFVSLTTAQTGEGVSDVLMGRRRPTGRLPFTIPVNESHLPPISDYDMTRGRRRP